MQLFTAFSCNPLFDESNDVDISSYGVGDSDYSDEDSEAVTIPAIMPPVSEHDLHGLQLAIDPLQNSDCYGADLYIETIIFINNALDN